MMANYRLSDLEDEFEDEFEEDTFEDEEEESWDDPEDDDVFDMDSEEEEEEDIWVRKEKVKRNVFYGEKTKRGFTRSGYRGNRTEELFHYLKKERDPDPYIRDFYWIDFKTRQVKNSKAFNKKYGGVLHGPYTKQKDGQVLVQGMYYHGVKHGRWTYYDRNDILLKKEKYFNCLRQWPRIL
jgi:hypothetical protein